jgi:hypothetical protein
MRVSCAKRWLILAALLALLCHEVAASIGDRLPDFRECVKVSFEVLAAYERREADYFQICETENCDSGRARLRRCYTRTVYLVLTLPSTPSPATVLDVPS